MNDKNITDADKKFDMGYRYYYGEGVEQDYTKAALLFMDAAEQGHAAAQCNLGMCYYCGKGTEQNDEQAVYWIRKAARQGDVEAMFCLATVFEETPEAQKAREGLLWLILAAKQGDSEAKKLLSEIRRIDYALVGLKAEELITLAEQGEIKGLANYGVRYFPNVGRSMGAARLKLIKSEMPEYSHLRSHFRGNPYFEEGESWPLTKDGNPLDFIFQIFDAGNFGLPGNIKLIQFYYDLDEQPWFAQNDGWLIKIYENINIDNAVVLDPENTDSDRYCEIEFEPISPREKSRRTQVGGSPRWIQADESPGGFQFLFQLDCETEAGLYWGDEGMIYTYYNPNTKKTWFELQSH